VGDGDGDRGEEGERVDVLTVDQDLEVQVAAGGVAVAAGLDVTDPEPLPVTHPLRQMPNCLLTPHVASTADDGTGALATLLQRNMERWIAGRPLLGKVDLHAGY